MKKMSVAVSIVLFGSVWGFFEATLGGVLHMVHLPMTGQIMGSIGVAIMFFAMRSGLKPSSLFSVSLVAASFKFADVYLFGLPVFDIKIINPAQAIAMEGLAFASMAALFRNVEKSFASKIMPASFVMISSMVLFNLLLYFVVGYRPTQNMMHPFASVFINLPVGIAISSVLMQGVDTFNERAFGVFFKGRFGLAIQSVAAAVLIAATVILRGAIG